MDDISSSGTGTSGPPVWLLITAIMLGCAVLMLTPLGLQHLGSVIPRWTHGWTLIGLSAAGACGSTWVARRMGVDSDPLPAWVLCARVYAGTAWITFYGGTGFLGMESLQWAQFAVLFVVTLPPALGGLFFTNRMVELEKRYPAARLRYLLPGVFLVAVGHECYFFPRLTPGAHLFLLSMAAAAGSAAWWHLKRLVTHGANGPGGGPWLLAAGDGVPSDTPGDAPLDD